MALNTCKMRFNGIKIAFFPKSYKKPPNGWVLRPQTPKVFGGWGLRPQTQCVIRLNYTSFLNTFPTLDICAF